MGTLNSGTSSIEGSSPGGRRLSRSFHSCLRGADEQDLGIINYLLLNYNIINLFY